MTRSISAASGSGSKNWRSTLNPNVRRNSAEGVIWKFIFSDVRMRRSSIVSTPDIQVDSMCITNSNSSLFCGYAGLKSQHLHSVFCRENSCSDSQEKPNDSLLKRVTRFE